jgi:hypothetical protein
LSVLYTTPITLQNKDFALPTNIGGLPLFLHDISKYDYISFIKYLLLKN